MDLQKIIRPRSPLYCSIALLFAPPVDPLITSPSDLQKQEPYTEPSPTAFRQALSSDGDGFEVESLCLPDGTLCPLANFFIRYLHEVSAFNNYRQNPLRIFRIRSFITICGL